MDDPADAFRRRLADRAPLLLDGAMGSELHARGLDTALPLWSAAALEQAPDAVAALHRDYVRAGAEIVTTNTFRTRRRTFAKVGRPEAAAPLARLAVTLARSSGARFVAGSLGPLEDCYEPARVPDDTACAAEHGELAAQLAEAGVDLLLVETMNTLREARAAVRAAQATGLPVIASFVCGGGAALLSGEPLAEAAIALLDEGVAALAVNCTPTATLDVPLRALLTAVAGRVPCGAWGNVGVTDAIQGFTCTEELAPDDYAERAHRWLDLGARIVGGCCGTGPAHIAAVARMIRARR